MNISQISYASLVAALVLASSSTFAQSESHGGDSGKCGVDKICLTESAAKRMAEDRSFNNRKLEMEHKLTLAKLQASITEQDKKSAKASGVPAKLPIKGPSRDVPPPDFANVGHQTTHSTNSSVSMNGIQLKAVVNNELATFEVDGRDRSGRVGDKISGYKIVALDFNSAKLKRPGSGTETLHVNW